MQQKWNQNFDGEPMTDIPQKFLNAGCDVYMVMQLRHDEKILDLSLIHISPDEASRMTKQQKRAMYAAAAARSAAHREIDQYEDDNAVSYTHLDVYKRQYQTSVSQSCRQTMKQSNGN